MNKKDYTLGVCLGASTISMALMKPAGEMSDDNHRASMRPKIVGTWRYPHEGNPKATLVDALGKLEMSKIDRIACTGRKFREYVTLTSIPEPVAVEYAYLYLKPADVDCPAIVSAGGETFMAYLLNRHGRIQNVLTGSRCASGTARQATPDA